MQAFLDKTAEYLYKTWGKDMGDICIVLPNRRSGLFLKKFLSGYAQKTIWSPEIASIEDFITGLSGCNIIDPVYLQFELYKIYNEAEGEKAGSFIEFLKWGRVLLNDFNEIDKYLIDPASLFDYLTDIRAIELWNPEKGILTAFELNYLHFYKSLKTYYEKLIKILVEKREVYSGLANRMVAAKAEEYAAQFKWKKVVFAGFNALTTSEKKIIFTLVAAGKAEVIWDTDRYYMDDEKQEAGRFIRSYIREFDVKEYKWPDDNFKKEEFRIHLLGVPQNVLQAKTAGNLLAEISKDNRELERTAVVLNDEFMLAPLLNSIPDSIGDFNLTMGLSLKSTPLYQLIDSVFNLQVNILKLNPEAINKRKIYFRDILRVLEHPYLSSTGEQKDLLQLPGKIRSSNKVFFNFDELMTYLPDPIPYTTLLFESLFKPWENFSAVALERIVILINLLKSKYSGNNLKSNSDGDVASIDLEYLFYFSKIFQKLKVLLQQYSIIDTLSTFRELFIQLSGSLNIPFYGEPLKGG
ncbi:MAG: hypothetical protein FJY07_03760, partial [Bacteroidetes bacterium]|nr:hypothetical protein [Bacteroidota bacterium]